MKPLSSKKPVGIVSLSAIILVSLVPLSRNSFLCAGETKPNVLFIAIDDLNSWVGFMGGHPNTHTPNLDQLAARGSIFLNAHCQAPICGPSRASLMTGLHPHTTGIYGHIKDEDIRSSSEATAEAIYLPECFRENGYTTLGIGKLFHTHAPKEVFEISGGRQAGFGPKPKERMHWEAEYTQTDWGAFPERDNEMPDYQSARWAAQRLNVEYRKPFFLAVGLLRPHVPWHVPQRWFDKHPLPGIQTPRYLPTDFVDIPQMASTVCAVPVMPTTDWAIKHDQWRPITQAYLACVSFADHCVGMVLKALEESRYADNTIIVLWSDHGYQLGEKNRFAKHALWREATQVPLVIVPPKSWNQDRQIIQRISQPVGLIDIYPTLVDMCDLASGAQLEGHSLLPLMTDADAKSIPVLTAYGRGNYAVTSERFRYIRYEDGSEELYDALTDPGEWHNLAELPQFKSIKETLGNHMPSDAADWAEKSFNPITEYFAEQKQRMGTRQPVTQGDR